MIEIREHDGWHVVHDGDTGEAVMRFARAEEAQALLQALDETPGEASGNEPAVASLPGVARDDAVPHKTAHSMSG